MFHPTPTPVNPNGPLMKNLLLVALLSTSSSLAHAGSALTAAPASQLKAPGVQSVHLELVGKSREYRDISEYDIAVDGEAFTVSIGAEQASGRVTLYDDEGGLVVGYRFSNDHMIIYDGSGLIDHGEPSELGLGVLEEYGPAAMLLTDPSALAELIGSGTANVVEGRAQPLGWQDIFEAKSIVDLSCVDVMQASDSTAAANTWSFAWGCP